MARIVFGMLLLPLCGATEISFFFTADPQYGFKGDDGIERAEKVTRDAARLTKLCTDCPQVLPIAGDLTMNGKELNTYAASYAVARGLGVKVLDGVGNHDTTSLPEGGTSFMTEGDVLSGGGSLATKGWEVVHFAKSLIDNGEGDDADGCGTFAKDPKYFCNTGAYYYTTAVSQPGATEAGAYVVQLHNGMYTASAFNYLSAVNAVLTDRTKPVVIVVHQFTGSKKSEIQSVLKKMNVAAIIHGHYHCNQDGLGYSHCDYAQNSPGYTIDAFGSRYLKNMHGTPVVRINANAAFHNIFWGLTLDTATSEVKLHRFNRGEVGDTSKYPAGTYRSLVQHMGQAGSSLAYTTPFKSSTPFTCAYGAQAGGERCITQIRGGGELEPTGSFWHQVHSEGFWGRWGELAMCPEGQYVFGYRLRSQEKQNWFRDDTALNDIELYCRTPTSTDVSQTIKSEYRTWGSWGSSASCSGTGNPVVGFKVRVEEEQGSGDDTGANDVRLQCSDGAWISSPVKTSWGSWSEDMQCSPGWAVAGLITRVEEKQSGLGDDTALNGVRLLCREYN